MFLSCGETAEIEFYAEDEMSEFDVDKAKATGRYLDIISLDEFGRFDPTDLLKDPALRLSEDFIRYVFPLAKPIEFAGPLKLAKFYSGEAGDTEILPRLQSASEHPFFEETQVCRIALQMGRAQSNGQEGPLETDRVYRFYLAKLEKVVWMEWREANNLSSHSAYWFLRISHFGVHRYMNGDIFFCPAD